MTGPVVMLTGPREIRCRARVRSCLGDVIDGLGPSKCRSGGAEGADSAWALAAVDRGVPLVLDLPNRYYRLRYPDAVPGWLVEAAVEVNFVVERPEVSDWRRRWTAERWWQDNFVRNERMVTQSDVTVCVSPRNPVDLAADRKGGTAACLRDVRRLRADGRVLWVRDCDDMPVPTWVDLGGNQTPTLFA